MSGLVYTCAVVWATGALPAENVPLHFDATGTADRFGSRTEALLVLLFIGVPYQLADNYFPEDIARDTPLMEPRSVSAPGGILAAIGHRQVPFVECRHP